VALTANRELNRYVDQELRSFGVAASEHVYKGAIVGLDRATGYARPLIAGDSFAGIAYEEIDNSGGQDGDVSIRVYTQGDFIVTVNSAVQSLSGMPVYALNDDSMTVAPGNGSSMAGTLMSVVGSSLGIVRIDTFGIHEIEHQVQVPLTGSTSSETTHVALLTQRPLRIISAEVLYITPPDQGALNVGHTLADPDDAVNNFNLASLSANSTQLLTLSSRAVPAGVSLLAKVGQASASAGSGGLLSLRYIELP